MINMGSLSIPGTHQVTKYTCFFGISHWDLFNVSCTINIIEATIHF